MTEPSVWAPNARERVDLVVGDERSPMTSGERGWWQATRDLSAGTDYAFSLDGGPARPDPRARRMRHGVHGASTWFDPQQLVWADDDWGGVELAGGLVYELHVGTFTAEGTLDSAITRLDHLVRLGVTLVELMPLAAFPGQWGWGYDGVDLYAVHEAYGGPEALHRFVQACHVKGLGVCLDVVYNHLGPSGNYLSDFGPYFTDTYTTPWGDAVNLDGPGSDEVRAFIIDNATQWLRDFHLDALRLDAVHALHDDDRALPLLEELSATVDRLAQEVGRPLWLIAESDRNDPCTVLPRARVGHLGGGVGVHAQWCDDVHHALHVALTGETAGYYSDFAVPGALEKVLTTPFFHDGTWSSFRGRTHGRPVDRARQPGWRFVASLQTHDQVGNRAAGERLSQLVDVGTLACGAALLLTGPYTPMLFMGEEWGASTPWQFFTDHQEPELVEAIRKGRQSEFASHGWAGAVPDPQSPDTVAASTLDWDEVAEGDHARLLQWYADLARCRRTRADLRDARLDRIVVHRDQTAQTVVVERGVHRVLVNLSDQQRRLDPWLGGDDGSDGSTGAVVIVVWDQETRRDATGAVTLPPRSACILGPPAAG
ncbi:MAG TPA: malto-oligosyltrehalose trehalohydrolase [Segeticoccus sp.]|uniref:malto-oligosyltrehalose trehalohydrolase n=1 Tax=Segeticoccus sp. TaxID=2706531 RepID=UPI002D7FA85B|nr:malto-oligosyltrehalose trehalohydrolase [Segeticoccus sp.]HET8601340.1 malto-oligosyltrehalose trehalohydrolase [Segeticoccus sp.]